MRLLDGSPSAQYVVSRELVVMLDAPRAGVPRRVRERFESASETHPSSNDERRAVSNERDVEVGCESRYEQPFLTTRLRETDVTNDVTDDVTDDASSRELQIARAFLDARLNGEHEYEGFEALLCDESVISLTTRLLARVEERGEAKFPAKMVLSAYMICYHADVVLGGSNAKEVPCEETSLIDSSKALVNAFDALALTMSRSGTFTATITNAFERAWHTWTADFKIWKSKDAFSLTQELIRIGVAMESSMIRVCGARGALDSTVDLGEERNAIRSAQSHDRALLREKVFTLSGKSAVDEFDAMITRVRAAGLSDEESARAKDTRTDRLDERRRKREATSAQIAAAIEKDKERARQQMAGEENVVSNFVEMQKDQILHELMLDPEWKLRAPPKSPVEDDPVREQVVQIMKKAFWDMVYESLVHDTIDTSIVRARIFEWKDAIIDDTLILDRQTTESLELIQNSLSLIDVNYLEASILRMESTPTDTSEALRTSLDHGYTALNALANGSVKDDLSAAFDNLTRELETATNADKFTLSRAIADALAFLFDFRERIHQSMSLEAANEAIDALRETLAVMPDGIEYATTRFLHRFDVKVGETELALAFPRTCAWLESVVEELPTLDATFAPLLDSLNVDRWRGVRLRSGFETRAEGAQKTSSEVISSTLHPTRVMSVNGVCRVAFARLVTNPNAMIQDFIPETLENDVQRIDYFCREFQNIQTLAACLMLSTQLCRLEVFVDVDALIDRVAVLLSSERDLPAMSRVAEVLSATLPTSDGAQTITNMLRKLTGSDDCANPMSVAIIKAIRSALTIRLLHGFEGEAVDRACDARLAAVFASRLRPRVDAIARDAARVINLHATVRAPVVSALVNKLLARDDEI